MSANNGLLGRTTIVARRSGGCPIRKLYGGPMKARQARKIFKRLSQGGSVDGYKCTTIAAAFTRSVGIYCHPEDAILVCQLSRMFANLRICGMLEEYINQPNTELAS